MVEAGKDYEERVAFLLKQLTNRAIANTSNPGGAPGNDLVDNVKDADIQKFSIIQKALQVHMPTISQKRQTRFFVLKLPKMD